jgi:L-rhamnose isomerase
MGRSTRAERARQLNAARELLQHQVALPEAMRRFSRASGLSRRQAYRYLKEASRLDQPVEITQATVAVTLKLPPQTIDLLRKHAKRHGLTIGSIVTEALQAFLGTRKKHG